MKKGAYKQLNLAHLEAALPELLDEARAQQWTYETFLEQALSAEPEGREQNAINRRLKGSPHSRQKDVRWLRFFLSALALRASFARSGRSLVCANLDQRHLSWPSKNREDASASDMSRSGTDCGPFGPLYSTLCVGAASHPGLLRQRLRRYIVPSVLVIDEVSYTRRSSDQARHFFELVNAHYKHGSIILTSNTSFAG